MNDLDLLRELGSELDQDPGLDRDGVEAAWVTLRDRIGIGPDPVVIPGPAARRPRRWAVPLAIAASVAAVLVALSTLLPSGAPGGPKRAQAAITFTTKDGYIDAVIKDPTADSEQLRAAFADHGLDITLQLVPVSPSLVGKFVFEGDSGNTGGSGIETLFDPNADCTTPGSLSCPIGLRIPLDFQGHADLALGRAAQPGEPYTTTNDAFASGEALHCSGLRGMTVQQALPVMDRLGLTAVWRSHDPATDNGNGVDPSTIADQYVTDAIPVAQGQVLIWASPDPPVQPEPGTALADYYARLDRGC